MKKKIILAETILLIASVFVFRSLWILLDKHPLMKESSVLLVSLIIGIAIVIISFYYIYRDNK